MATANIPTQQPNGDGRMSALLAQNWWALAIRGAAAILFGAFAIIAPGATMVTLALFFAAYLLIDGVFGVVAAVRAARRQERWGLLLAEGVLHILMSAIVFLFPVGAVLAFVFVTAAWALIAGALKIAAASKLSRDHGRLWLGLSGVLSILFAVALVAAPLLGAVVLTWWLGGFAVAFGVVLLVLAFRLRRHKDDILRAAG